MNKRKLYTILLSVTVLIAATAAVGAETYEPGSENDPVVTKSYVDSKIAAISSDGEGSVFQPVDAGDKLIGGEGTEIILRSGEAKAITNGTNGISDLTSGKDLSQGAAISQNHLLLVPRADGRGISAVTGTWVLIKGSYTIQ